MIPQPPFRGEDMDDIIDAILADEPTFPEHTPSEAVDLMRKLLVRTPEQRLGYHKGAEEIMDHEFFNSIDWDVLYKKEVTPPFRPTIKDRNDLSNIDEDISSMGPLLSTGYFGMSTSFRIS